MYCVKLGHCQNANGLDDNPILSGLVRGRYFTHICRRTSYVPQSVSVWWLFLYKIMTHLRNNHEQRLEEQGKLKVFSQPEETSRYVRQQPGHISLCKRCIHCAREGSLQDSANIARESGWISAITKNNQHSRVQHYHKSLHTFSSLLNTPGPHRPMADPRPYRWRPALKSIPEIRPLSDEVEYGGREGMNLDQIVRMRSKVYTVFKMVHSPTPAQTATALIICHNNFQAART